MGSLVSFALFVGLLGSAHADAEPMAGSSQEEASLAPPKWKELEVLSANGLYRAEIRRAAGYEEKPAKFSRWRLTVSELAGEGEPALEYWSAHFPFDGSDRHYLLSNDGATFVHLSEAYQQYRSVMTVFERGRELSSPKGNSFRLAREDTPSTGTGRVWLAENPLPDGLTWFETSVGPELTLEVHCRGEKKRWIDIHDARIWNDVDFDRLFTIEVSPALSERLADLVTTPDVRSFSVPKIIRAGAPLSVHVQAEFTTQGWNFEGFQWSQSGNQGRELRITARARRPLNLLVPAETIPFTPIALIYDLVPGPYTLEVLGANEPPPPPIEIEVLPADLHLLVSRTGRPGRDDEELRYFGRGELIRRLNAEPPKTIYLTQSQRKSIERALALLPDRSHKELGQTSIPGQTVFTYWPELEAIEQVRDVTSLSRAMSDLLTLFDELK